MISFEILIRKKYSKEAQRKDCRNLLSGATDLASVAGMGGDCNVGAIWALLLQHRERLSLCQ
jgi:hypothetical protein